MTTMKIFKKSLFTLLALTLLFSFTTTQSNYVGKWKGKDNGDIGYIILSEDGYATFEFDGETMGGKSYYQQNVEVAMKYIINDLVFPSSIDFIIVRNSDNRELGRLKGIIDMQTINEMQLALNFEGTERPNDFSKDAVIFHRVK